MNKIKSVSVSMLLLVSIFAPCFVAWPTVAQTTDPIKIGLFTPDVSGLAVYAPWTKQGFELGMIYATTESGYVNENKTAAGLPYEIHYYDTQGDPTIAATLATDAIESDGVDILVGGTYSSVAAAIAPVAEEYEKIYFITPAADAALTGDLFNPYIFRIARNNWHDAYAGVTYAMDTLGHTKFAFLAADYSFGYSGVESMTAVIEEKGGEVVEEQFAPLGTTDFSPYITNLITTDGTDDIEYLFVIWAGSFTAMYADFATYEIYDHMEVAGACIDILSMNLYGLEEGATGLGLYGYDLPNNAVNDWMVAEHAARNIAPNGWLGIGHDYEVPELFTASAFATAQFLVAVTNAVPDLNTDTMIAYLESGITLNCPKGTTYLRPQDHQGLAEMYIAEAWRDNRTGSETEGFVIAKLVETLAWNTVAPPIESNYTPTGGYLDPLTIAIVAGAGIVIVLIIAVIFMRRR
jgi:branched-chain amino acid transport system substrate-binding protein